MNNNILILDDEEQFQSDHRRKLKEVPGAKGFELPVVTVETFSKDLLVLLDRAKHGGRADDEKQTCFDTAAILFVDYRLIDLKLEGFFTGELVAYLARCFSDCGVIVGVNQFGDRVFDLSLCGHPTSFADINIGAVDIENKGFWQDEWTGFRPWHWPLLSQEVQKLEKRVAELSDLDVSVFEFIGLTPSQVTALPRSVLEFVTNRTAAEANQTTIREFIIDSGNGLNRKEKTSENFERRVAAARLSKWIERFLLGGQNTLVDAPHLVTRFPSLLDAPLDAQGLNRIASFVSADELPLKSALISTHEFRKSNWISRPAWFWEPLKDDNAVDEVREPWNRCDVPFRFCEDTSRFHSPESCKEFVADLPSPFTRRYVQRLPDVAYVPELRFSM
jgi:hypothetical protein